MTVESDKSKFGKTKFNRGRYIEGQWVFGGICRQRDKGTLLPCLTDDHYKFQVNLL